MEKRNYQAELNIAFRQLNEIYTEMEDGQGWTTNKKK